MTNLTRRHSSPENSADIAAGRSAGLRRRATSTHAYSSVTSTWRGTSGKPASSTCGIGVGKCHGSAATNTATIARYTETVAEVVDAELYGSTGTSTQLTLTVHWARIRSMGAPYKVIVFPYVKNGKGFLYAVFKRKDLQFWQAISGGGENRETPIQAAKREAFEEAKIGKSSRFIKLNSMTTIPIADVGTYQGRTDVLVLPEYSFGVEVLTKELTIGKEHSRYLWLPYERARKRLKYDSNKSALWELHYRLTRR